ncbi:MAG: DUF3667 domain-containing protein [bacterium]
MSSELVFPTPTEVRSTACLNCGAALSGPFCAACGQRDIPPYPSTRELVVDAFWELSGWDGRFAATVRALVERPGMLTREFLEGRRARYLSPLRLYLLASLVYFVLAASAPNSHANVTTSLKAGAAPNSATGKPESRPQRVGNEAKRALTTQEALAPEERESALKDIARAPAVMQPFLRKAVLDPAGFKRGILEAMPRMLFALLPIYAGIVAIFYRRRKYPEHLYFAIHLHAFVFLALSLSALAEFTRLPIIAGIVGFVSVVWIPVYATLAFRRVYGGSLMRTLVKEAFITAIYCAVSTVAFVITLYLVSMTK